MRYKKIINTIVIIGCITKLSLTSHVFCQNKTIDSISQTLKHQVDTQYVNSTLSLADEFLKIGKPALAIQKLKLGLKKAESIHFIEGQMNLKGKLGFAYCAKFDFDQAKYYYTEALNQAEALKNKVQIAKSYIGLGYLNEYLNKKTVAFNYYMKANKLSEETGDLNTQARSLNNIANLYQIENKLDLALNYHQKAIELKFKFKDTFSIANSYHNMAHVYKRMGDFDKSKEYYEKAIKFRKLAHDNNGLAFSYVNLGVMYEDIGENDKAKNYILKGIKLYQQMDNHYELSRALLAYGVNLFYRNNLNVAIDSSFSSLNIAVKYKFNDRRLDALQMLTVLYQNQKDFENAYTYYTKYIDLKDSLRGIDEANELKRLQVLFDAEKKQQEIKLLNKEAHIIQLQRNKDQMWIFFLIASISLLVILSVLLFNRFKIKQKANLLLQHQNSEISHQKKEITDSINYAKRIQESILPPQIFWKKTLPNSFILYKPKDIVSGDFYWMDKKDDIVFFAAVDCTGHGVPGAMMSVVGFNLLSAAVNEANLKKPSEILSFLDEGVTKTLRQTSDGLGVKDGMDLALCAFHEKEMKIEYAGAFNSLYHCTDGALTEIKADKFPIGINLDGIVDQYTNHTIELKNGDSIYIFSDGYADQFGGEKGKKFKYSKFKELLLKNSMESIDKQLQNMEDAFIDWMKDYEQVDDVLVIGLKV